MVADTRITEGVIEVVSDPQLTYWANISAIGGFAVTLVGAIVGIYGYIAYRRGWARKKRALVSYLQNKKETASGGRKAQFTTIHLIRHVGLTEEEILKISFESKHIRRVVSRDEAGRADLLFFEYE